MDTDRPAPPSFGPRPGGDEAPDPGRIPAELRAAVEAAFDYRGDVTLSTRDGRSVAGFVFNRVGEGVPEPYLEYYVKDAAEPRRMYYREIASIALTGRDAAAGRSWEAWVRKVQERRKAQTEGRDIGDIEPHLMPLDNE